jgi:tetratricopeptide (TPR) repeat protein
MGWLLFASGRYDDADRVFEQVVTNKPDYANGWYNWAYTAKKNNRLAEAVQRLSQAVALVPVDSGDYDKAAEELLTWKKELDEAIKKQQELATQQEQKEPETLKTSEPLPTGGKVVVPNGEMEPPEITPIPTVAEEEPVVEPEVTENP